jgi:hydroxyquinol 1,2-dioxygenase
MRNFDVSTITDAVLQSVSKVPEKRIRQISEAVVRHLHALVKEIEPTQTEWEQAIEFLTRVGHMCNETRQEFILLSDTLGISMLVDAINHRHTSGATETTILGPFYVQDPREFALGSDVSGGRVEGEPLFVSGSVASEDGTCIADAIVDIWHADGDGYYDVQRVEGLDGFAMRARLRTDADGKFYFWSVRPSAYPIPHDGPVGEMLAVQNRHPYRPAHVHFMVAAPGCETLVTHVFADGDEYLDSDVVFGVKDSLVRNFVGCPAGVAPDGRHMDKPYTALEYNFRLAARSQKTLRKQH